MKKTVKQDYGIGRYISENSRQGFWGSGAIETISQKLQQELPGLRGFSASNIKNMRLFFKQWDRYFQKRQPPAGVLKTPSINVDISVLALNRQPTAGDLSSRQIELFFMIGFTHHCEILNKSKTLKERLFYIEQCAIEHWSKENLRYYLKSNLYIQKGKLQSNFKNTISDEDLKRNALLSFKDEYLLDYINIEDPDDEPDERVLESEIVINIKKFIMSLGNNFSFLGNQYRLVLEDQEFFIEYAFRDTTKPMGVATYKTVSKLPPQYKDILPNSDQLKELLKGNEDE